MERKAKKIFIADDDEDILHIIKLMLQTQGYQVESTVNANEIFNYSATNLPDVVLLDIWMSGIDGREICRKMKKNKETKHIPVIFVSANSNIEVITKQFKADGFIAKPFEMDHLLEQINSFVH